MPLYVYRCERCGAEIEELQKFEDPPPRFEDDPCPATQGDAVVREESEEPCNFTRVPTTFTQNWRGEYSNEGRAGWTRQGDVMIRAQKGKNTTKYGEGSV